MNSFGSLKRRSWQWVSVLISAAVFGFAHVAGKVDYNFFIYAALGGVLAWTLLANKRHALFDWVAYAQQCNNFARVEFSKLRLGHHS